MIMSIKTIWNKLKLDSNCYETVKIIAERFNVLSWAFGGINYLGFNITGFEKGLVVVIGFACCQYVSLKLMAKAKKLSKN